MAQAISGPGPFSFDTSTATTDGLPDPLCLNFGSDDIFLDVWFSWTAATSGRHTISLCQPSTVGDTRVAVYSGGCGSAIDGCNDDVCGVISELKFDAAAGQTYLLRLGNFDAAPGTFASGDFTVEFTPPPQNPANGHFYELVSQQLSWTDAAAAANASLLQGVPGHLVTITDQAELDWIINNLAPSRPWIGLSQNLASPSYSEPGGGFEWVTGEPLTFTNWSAGEPSNNSASGGSEEFVEMFASGVWNDAEDAHAQTTQYIVEWDSGGIGTNYCMAETNSAGTTGTMSATGSAVVANDNLTLVASDLPNGQFGIFVTSRTQGFSPGTNGTSNGNLCLGGAIGRFVGMNQIVFTGSNGEFSLRVPLTMVPQGGGFVAVMPGDSWNFQAWHRDAIGLGSNLTDGLQIMFQ